MDHLLRSLVVLLTLHATLVSATPYEAATNSALDQRVKAGRYRVVQLSASPAIKTPERQNAENEQMIIVTLQSTDADPGTAYNLSLPHEIAKRYRLRADSIVLIKHRVYGLLFSNEGEANTPFYLLLDPEWEKTNGWKRVE